jgi:hypothetical protein
LSAAAPFVAVAVVPSELPFPFESAGWLIRTEKAAQLLNRFSTNLSLLYPIISHLKILFLQLMNFDLQFQLLQIPVKCLIFHLK